MIVRRLGRRRVSSVNEDFPIKTGDVIRVSNPNGTFLRYTIVSKGQDFSIAEVTHHTPTTNKFQIGGPNLRG